LIFAAWGKGGENNIASCCGRLPSKDFVNLCRKFRQRLPHPRAAAFAAFAGKTLGANQFVFDVYGQLKY
jgi:hypothetical protein